MFIIAPKERLHMDLHLIMFIIINDNKAFELADKITNTALNIIVNDMIYIRLRVIILHKLICLISIHYTIKGLAKNLEKSLTSVPLIEVTRELCQCYMYFVLGMQA